MNEYKTNLIEEKAQLEQRLEKLNAFNASEEAKQIDAVQRSISKIQAGAMYTYLECLNEALDRM